MISAAETRRLFGSQLSVLGPHELRKLGFVEYEYPKGVEFEVPLPKHKLVDNRYTILAVPKLRLRKLRETYPAYFAESKHWAAISDRVPTDPGWRLFDKEPNEIRPPWQGTSFAEAAFYAIAFFRRHGCWPVEGVFDTCTPVLELTPQYRNCVACLGIVDGQLRPVILSSGAVLVAGAIAILKI